MTLVFLSNIIISYIKFPNMMYRSNSEKSIIINEFQNFIIIEEFDM